jgi:hypothetical protein
VEVAAVNEGATGEVVDAVLEAEEVKDEAGLDGVDEADEALLAAPKLEVEYTVSRQSPPHISLGAPPHATLQSPSLATDVSSLFPQKHCTRR